MATFQRTHLWPYRCALFVAVALSTVSCGSDPANDEARTADHRSGSEVAEGSLEDTTLDATALGLVDEGGSARAAACDRSSLDACLTWGGGDACYVKWGCAPGQKLPASDDKGAAFSHLYLSDYASITRKVDAFYRGSFRCAAFASTALGHAGFKVTQKLVTNEVETQLKALGWRPVTDMTALRSGDVVFTDKATSNLPDTWSHVYVFHRYEGQGTAIISDNNGNGIKRNVGPGPRSVSKLAYRAPEAVGR